KWYLMLGSLQAEQQFVIGVLIVSSLMNIAYLLPIGVRAFYSEPPADKKLDHGHDDHGHDDHGHDDHGGGFWLERFGLQEAPMLCVVPLALTAFACVILFIHPDPFLELARAIRFGRYERLELERRAPRD